MHQVKEIVFDGLRGRVVQPLDANGAGVLQIPAWQGLNIDSDTYAQWFADAGFTVLSCDPFSAYPPDLPREDRRRITAGEILDSTYLQEHVHYVDYLREQLGCDGIGTMG